jgi:hypothetical protein
LSCLHWHGHECRREHLQCLDARGVHWVVKGFEQICGSRSVLGPIVSLLILTRPLGQRRGVLTRQGHGPSQHPNSRQPQRRGPHRLAGGGRQGLNGCLAGGWVGRQYIILDTDCTYCHPIMYMHNTNPFFFEYVRDFSCDVRLCCVLDVAPSGWNQRRACKLGHKREWLEIMPMSEEKRERLEITPNSETNISGRLR